MNIGINFPSSNQANSQLGFNKLIHTNSSSSGGGTNSNNNSSNSIFSNATLAARLIELSAVNANSNASNFYPNKSNHQLNSNLLAQLNNNLVINPKILLSLGGQQQHLSGSQQLVHQPQPQHNNLTNSSNFGASNLNWGNNFNISHLNSSSSVPSNLNAATNLVSSLFNTINTYSQTTCNLNNTLFVGNLHASLQEADLIQVFRPFGRIVECCKKWLHFGFVKFTTEEEACHAYVTLNGFRLKGRPMRLEFQNRSKKVLIFRIFISNQIYFLLFLFNNFFLN
jgi:hypothetical protein